MQLKKNRDKENQFIVEGKKSVLEFTRSDFRVLTIVGTTEFFDQSQLDHISCEKIVAKEADLIATGTLKTNNAAIAVIEKLSAGNLKPSTEGVILALDGINDPGNLGTIIRTADWFGINKVLLNEDSVDPFNPKVINASKGSMSRVKVYTQSLHDFLKSFKGEVLAADMTGQPLSDVKPITNGVIIMGNESHGLSKPVEKYITKKVTIPALGMAESLNVGVATGIICYALTAKN